MATIVAPLAFAIAGALAYAFMGPKPSELGRITFFAGMLWLVFMLTRTTFHF
jgi:hypothetical protein